MKTWTVTPSNDRVCDYSIVELPHDEKGIIIHEAYMNSSSDLTTKTSYIINDNEYPILMGSLVRNIETKKTYMFDEKTQAWVQQ